MRARKIVLVSFIIVPILLGLVITPQTYPRNSISNDSPSDSLYSLVEEGKEFNSKAGFSLSQDTQTGILNPARMVQRGHQDTSLLRARTDSGKNTQQNITIDEANHWTASRTEVEVTNLRKLYAVNGTFDDEVDPWTSSTYDPSGGKQTQTAVWNSTEGYVTVANIGEFKDRNPPQDDTYTHHYTSEIVWSQTVTNSPLSNNFSLSFRYRYVSGPVDPAPYDFSGDVELRIYVHTDTYYMSIATGDLRGVWYSITDYPIELTGAPASFTVGIGIYIEYADLVLTENGDYDDDGFPDGLINAQKIEVNLDDFEFKSQTPVPYSNVELTFNAEGLTSLITGPTGGIGTSTISNSTPWNVSPLQIEVTANTSVSFEYSVTTYFQRDINSSWTTDLSKQGVSYTIDSGQSSDLVMYTYVSTSTEYQNLTLTIEYPSDWENITILDPLNNDITGLCSAATGSIYVPNSLFTRVGWWKITYQAFNYAKIISIQMQDSFSGNWTENSLFRTGNITRTQVEIGTASVTPEAGAPVDIEWIRPNGAVWASDSISSIIGGQVNSSSWVLGGTNTSAGEWVVEVFWNNGTELAYGHALFDLYHQASVTVSYPIIEADYGQIISNLITFKDADTGEYLLDDSVSIVANWSSTIVTFTQNYAKNWWEADFDTTLLGNGRFVVDVNASMPYFDMVASQFTVISLFETSLEILNAGSAPIENGLNEIFTVLLSYELLNGTGVAGAVPTISHSGQENSLAWSNFVDNNNGFYAIDIRCNISGIYEIAITLSKPFHYNTSDSFTLLIRIVDTTVQGSSPFEALLIGRSYTFIFSYIFESNSSYIHGATILAFGDGAGWITYTELESGQYIVNLTPLEIGEHYTILTFEKDGFETASYRLTFSVERVPISVEVLQGLSAPELSQSTILVRISETDTDQPVSGLEVYCYIIDPNGASGSSIIMDETSTSGVYSAVIIMPAAEGVYQLQITCEAENYALESSFIVQLQPGRDFMTMLWVATTRYYPFMLILTAVCVGLVYRRSKRKQRIRENKDALAVKRRFDDVKSLLGVIVLHKDSGLPVYSKILREGLEETVISAFITAITSFRGEFDIESSSEEWGLIPISDIVRVISTNKLVCAFITTGNPSPEQREKMIQFAKKVGFIFDETMSDVPIVVLDQRTRKQFDTLFEDILDGALLRTYMLDDEKKIPTNTCANERIARKQGVQFKLDELAFELATCGLEEGRVYKAIMTALENHFLVTSDESPFASEIIRAPESVPDET